MKKLKMLIYILLINFLFVPAVYAIEATQTSYVACGEATGIPAPVPQLTSIAYTLLITATPVLLIVFSIVTLLKAITAGSQDDIMKAKNKLIKKFVIAGAVFFVAVIVRFVVTKAADATEKDSISNCLNCFLYHNDCRESVGPYEAGGLIGTNSNSSSNSSTNSSSSTNSNSSNNSSPTTIRNDITKEYPTNWLACRYRNDKGDEYQLEFPNNLVVRHKESGGYVRVKPESFKYELSSEQCPEQLRFLVSNGFLTIRQGNGNAISIYTKYSTNRSNSSNSNRNPNSNSSSNSNSNNSSNSSSNSNNSTSITKCEYLSGRKDESDFSKDIYSKNCEGNNNSNNSIPTIPTSKEYFDNWYNRCEELYNGNDTEKSFYSAQCVHSNNNKTTYGNAFNSPALNPFK